VDLCHSLILSGGFQRELQDLILNLGDALVSNMQILGFHRFKLESSKSKEVSLLGKAVGFNKFPPFFLQHLRDTQE